MAQNTGEWIKSIAGKAYLLFGRRVMRAILGILIYVFENSLDGVW